MTAFLILENGTIFKGEYFGAQGEVTGEIVFTTGITGYLETLTDPSYYGQIVLQTFPLICNYGVIPSGFESAVVGTSAYIVKHPCGTGACACAVAAVLNGYCDRGADIKVQLLCGELIINYTDEAVYMTGDCKKVFDGTVEI